MFTRIILLHDLSNSIILIDNKVRRDQCALTQKILRNALIKAFKRGIAPTKDYLRTQWSLIHAGKFPVSDFVLTGRVRSRYRGGRIGPVQAALARRLGEIDPGRVVRHKERLVRILQLFI